MTTEAFGAQLLALPLIFENRLFTIPDYQRGYAWEKKQVEELLKDIDHLMNDGVALRHYTGTLVLSRPDGIDEGEFHVVDGQQRLTTLVTLMRMLSEHLPADDRPVFDALYLRRGEVGSDRSVLRLNSDTHLFFERVVLGDGNTANAPATLEAHERLLESRKLIGKWLVERLATGVKVSNIRNVIETDLGFLVYSPKEDSETGIMFEVINNRGKQLSELEKVKNYLIYCCVKLSATTLRSSIDSDWSGILRDLNTAKKTSPSDEGAFLRYCVAVHFKLNKTDSQYGYDELKKLMALDEVMKDGKSKQVAILRITAFVDFLRTAALWYARLYGHRHEGLDPELGAILNQIRAQEQQASIMPLFLALVIKSQAQRDRLILLLKLLEILNFRVYMARNMTARNDTGQGDLYWYASRYYHDELLAEFSEDDKRVGKQSIESQEDALEYFLVKFVLWLAADERFKNSFILEPESPDDFYRWGGLRYFLMNYEAKLQPNKKIPIEKILLSRKEGKSADYLSVEHLWALENRNQEGENNRKVDKFEKRRLGNFVLLELRLNIQGSKDSVELKLPRYLKGFEDEPPTDLAQVRKMARNAETLTTEFAKETKSKNYFLRFYRNLNERQEARYVDFADSRWSIKQFIGYKQLVKDAMVANADEDENEYC
jgi:Protein of unknown function DUF262/Protein of unknown function (DUF1524)